MQVSSRLEKDQSHVYIVVKPGCLLAGHTHVQAHAHHRHPLWC